MVHSIFILNPTGWVLVANKRWSWGRQKEKQNKCWQWMWPTQPKTIGCTFSMTGSIRPPVSAWHVCLSKAAELQEPSLPHTMYGEKHRQLQKDGPRGFFWLASRFKRSTDLIVKMLKNNTHAWERLIIQISLMTVEWVSFCLLTRSAVFEPAEMCLENTVHPVNAVFVVRLTSSAMPWVLAVLEEWVYLADGVQPKPHFPLSATSGHYLITCCTF